MAIDPVPAPEALPVSHGDVGRAWSAIRDQTIIELTSRACRADPERPAMIFEDGVVVSRAALLERAERFAAWLGPRLAPRDRVAIMLPNRAEFMIALLAVAANRAMLVSLNPTAQAHDAGHVLADSAAVLAITDSERSGLFESLRGRCPALREVVVLDGEEPAGLDACGAAGARLDFARSECQREDIVTIYYTSGSTGPPKGCMLHHGWWLRVLDVDLRLFAREPEDRQLCCMPFYYADPAIQLLTSLATGGTLVVMRRFSVSRFWKVARELGATEFLSVASVPTLLLKGSPGAEERAHRIRLAIHAGVPRELHRELEDRFGFPWLDNYGSTECGHMARMPLAQAGAMVGEGSLGVPDPEVEIRLVDDADRDVPAGEVGESLIRSPDQFRGYLGDREATAEAFQDGWYRTGDLLRRDARGLLYFVGRKKDIIRRSGENIAAAEVEEVLRGHPRVTDAAVIPVPDPIRGEEVKAYVQPAAGETQASLPAGEIVAHCAARLAPFKVPRYVEYRTSDLPRLPSMRVDKQALKREREDLIAGCWDREAQR